MALDVRTMIVMTALLAIMLAGLLALASLHAGTMRGIRHWALAELCVGLGLGFAFVTTTPGSPWALITGAFLLVVGVNLQLVGIRAFQGRPDSWWWMWCTTLLTLASNVFFTIIYPDVSKRAICNALILAILNAACARAMLVKAPFPLQTAYWLTGGAFALITVVFLMRALVVAVSAHGTYTLYAPLPINPLTFFAGSIIQMTLAFGFVLIINYQIAGDLHRLAARDSLTGVLNRRQLEEDFSHLRALYLRSGGVLSFMMIDVDHFKHVNDKYGHLTGDEVLRRLVAVIEATIRKQDYLARYGGEEFCILLPATTEDEAAVIAERLRHNYAETSMGQEDKPWFSTISIGVTDSLQSGFEFHTMIAAADRALYFAKESGRNKVVISSTL